METVVRTGSTENSLCPVVEEAFGLLGKKWIGLILHVLARGEMHFCEIERAIPSVSARVLASRVKDLEEKGLVIRTVHPVSPVRVTYRLTGKGQDLVPVLKSFTEWAYRWKEAAYAEKK